MELYLQKLVTALLILLTILHFQGSSSGQECPYPCYPPPTGPGNNPTPTPETSNPPPFTPQQGGAALYPPPGSGGIIPYYPPPTGTGGDDGGNGGGSGMAPPPPEPIVPWFPYYFRKPPHPIESSSIALRGSFVAIALVAFSMCSVLY